MSDQPAELPEDHEHINVQFSAHFREDGCREEVIMTLGEPTMPNILFLFASDPESDIMNIRLDVTGFSPESLIAFLEETVEKMKTTPAVEVLPDGTRRPARFQQAQPETAEKE